MNIFTPEYVFLAVLLLVVGYRIMRKSTTNRGNDRISGEYHRSGESERPRKSSQLV